MCNKSASQLGMAKIPLWPRGRPRRRNALAGIPLWPERQARKEEIMSDLFRELQPYLERAGALEAACTLFNWDQNNAPGESIENTSKIIGTLSGEHYAALINDEVRGLLIKLSTKDELEKLSFHEKSIVKVLNKQFHKLSLIPPEEYQHFSMLTAKAYPIWEAAKNNNDYTSYAPVLQEIIDYSKKFAAYGQKEGQPLYDVALDDYEEGFTMEILDSFFDSLKEALGPLVKKISEKTDVIPRDFLQKFYPADTQKEFCHFLAEYIGFDFNRGLMGESEHPFTTQLHNHDVRITNHYLENKVDSAIFSVIHEAGHGLYEQGIDDAITMTIVGSGTSMGMHESQSRFYENNLGRSLEFWMPVYGKLKDTYPDQLAGVSLEDFYKGINYSHPSLIRTEADELTYPFHIMIRYEIEKAIFSENVTANELPVLWNEKYKEYLGIVPGNDTEGILQDMHWSGGSFGYFPSYAIGSAIAAQIYHHLESVMPIKDYLLQGQLTPIRNYLKEHIHRFGQCKNTQELLMDMTGEGFNPNYYIQYLTEKFTKLYGL